MTRHRQSAIKRMATKAGLALRHAQFRALGLFHDKVTLQTRQGLLTMSTRDMGIAAPLYRHREYEFDLTMRAVHFLKARGFIPRTHVRMLDVGANIGIIGIGLLLASELSHVLAIEPEPENFALLLENMEQNGLADRMTCLQVALGTTEGTLRMELSADNPGDHRIRSQPVDAAHGEAERYGESKRRTIEVPSMPLAKALAQPRVQAAGMHEPNMMWIDVQGYEGHVFKGAEPVLSGGLPTVSEIWPYGIRRSGMTPEEFQDIAAGYWSEYWLHTEGEFDPYPIAAMGELMKELEKTKRFANVIFTKSLNRTNGNKCS